jgi:hypothetical protein
MGARTNFHFVDGDNTLTLYSHWGGDTRKKDLANALLMASPRKGDNSYFLRIAVSQIVGNYWDAETGFGIFLNEPDNPEEQYGTLIVNLNDWTVSDDGVVMPINSFVEQYRHQKAFA